MHQALRVGCGQAENYAARRRGFSYMDNGSCASQEEIRDPLYAVAMVIESAAETHHLGGL